MATEPRHNPITLNLTPGEPVRGVALLYPPQGSWTEADYFELDQGRIVEFDKGCVEVHDMPTKAHQRIVRFLFQLLHGVVSSARLGEVFFAPLPVRLWSEKFREPDVVFVQSDRSEFRGYPEGADLVIEVVSEGEANRRRDIETKREEYFRAGIAEYWIVDPKSSTITILSGRDASSETYIHERVYGIGEVAASQTLSGFLASVQEVFAAAGSPE